jgi:PAS domain S-box-containing protein
MLDVKTIYITSFLIYLCMAAILGITWRYHSAGYKGIGLWFSGMCAGVLSFPLIAGREFIPLSISVVMGITLLPVGLACIVRGLEKYFGLDSSLRLQIFFILATFSWQSIFLLIFNDVHIRITGFNAICAAQVFHAACRLLTRVPRKHRQLIVPTAIIFMGLGGLFLYRFFLHLPQIGSQNIVSPLDPTQAPPILLFLVLTVLLVFSLVVMLFQRQTLALEHTARQLEKSEERYRTVVDNSPTGIAVIETDGTISMANRSLSEQLGVGQEAVRGKQLSGWFARAEDEQAGQCRGSEVLGHSERGQCGEVLIQQPGGARKRLELHTAKLDAQGSQTIIQSIDRTEEYQQQQRLAAYQSTLEEMVQEKSEQLVSAEKMASIGILVSGVGHEISNPTQVIAHNLAAVNTFLDMAAPFLEQGHAVPEAEGDGPPPVKLPDLFPKVRGGIVQARQACSRISKIVNDLRDFSQPDDESDPAMYDLRDMIRSAAEFSEQYLNRRTRCFQLELPDDPLDYCCRPHQMEQVVINLLQNAADSLTSEQGTISLAAWKTEAGLHIRVRDTGRGIAPENLSQVTSPFYTTNREQGGTGLGLYVAARIIENANGILEIQSEPGRGTCVEIVLPVRHRPDKAKSGIR